MSFWARAGPVLNGTATGGMAMPFAAIDGILCFNGAAAVPVWAGSTAVVCSLADSIIESCGAELELAAAAHPLLLLHVAGCGSEVAAK